MTSDPQSWEGLKASLANWINRDDLGTTEIPEAILLAERRFNRLLRVPEMEAVVSATTLAAAITLPTDFLQARAVHLATDPKVVLEPMTPAELRSSYPAATTGKPRHFAIQSGIEMVFGPSPDSAYPIVLIYYQAIPALGDDQATNWLLTAHPDTYLHAALFELFLLTMDEQRAGYHDGKLGQIIEEINRSAHRKAYGASPIRIRSSVVV